MLATNYPIWSLTCGQSDICSSGCSTACEFFSSHPQTTVPLSQHNSRLTLVFSGVAAHWTLAWGRAAPREHVVYAVFGRTGTHSWRSLLQTSATSASLAALAPGDDLKLVAVAESGVLSVIITPYDPPPHHKSGITLPRPQVTFDPIQTNDIDLESDGTWTLSHEAEVEASGLVGVRVWWPPVRLRGTDYLVTWEVDGGGLKGHLYTDLAEVDLTLWPNTVYQVHVEAVTGPMGRPFRSGHLTLDTHNITLVAQANAHQNQLLPPLPLEPPLVRKIESSISVALAAGIGVGCVVAVVLMTGLVWLCTKNNTNTTSPCPSSKCNMDPWISTKPELHFNNTVRKMTTTTNTTTTTTTTNTSHQLPPPVFPSPSRPVRSLANLYTIVPPPRPHLLNV
ncbi:hypothetical protein Pmani_016557 [Petrolisthes manimaculis]|uniref:Uncharacterized protein n=1 Tax=Petrolisthes manimaculis TaxID=1843537 RepID=A0AAE1PQ25_9EUCA|nr:hypothetical protein Pmani_016557 [Petrolisthes manimaculis]